MSDSRTALPRASLLWSRAYTARVCRPAQYLQVSAFHFYFGMSLCLWSLLVLGEFRATCSVVKNKTIPFVILSLRPIFCSFDTSLSSLIPDINWSSHLLQYSRLPLCCLTHPFQAVTYSLRKNSFNSHEVYLKVFFSYFANACDSWKPCARFSGSSWPAMEKRKATKALPFACHFSLTGTVRFFCCFFDRRLAVVPSIELAPISEHLNKLFTISAWIFPERIMFKGKYTSVLLGQTGILCSFYLGHFLKCVQ